MNSIYSWHPVVTGLYLGSVLLITMFTTNPIMLFLALFGGTFFCGMTETGTAFWKNFAFYILLFVLIALTNPLFSHNGVTPLFFLNGNPITLEAVLYGIDIAIMLIAVIYWFKCFNHIMTSDKLLFLMGILSPKIALLISSALRFIPLLKTQAKKIRQTQKAMGLFSLDSWSDKIRSELRVFSSLITWALENAIDTGSSMKGRGYGLKGRSHFAIYRFTRRNGMIIALIALLDVIVVTVMVKGALSFEFYPKVSELEFGNYTILAYVAFGVLVFLPVILEVKENIQWKYYKSKI